MQTVLVDAVDLDNPIPDRDPVLTGAAQAATQDARASQML